MEDMFDERFQHESYNEYLQHKQTRWVADLWAAELRDYYNTTITALVNTGEGWERYGS